LQFASKGRQQMRKRSTRKPRHIRLDAVLWVIAGMKRVASLPNENMIIRMRNRLALDALLKGKATREDLDVVIAAANMAQALTKLKIGQDYKEEIDAAHESIVTMCRRGIAHGDRFVFTGPEMATVKLLMDIHDAQLDSCTVAQMEQGLDIVTASIIRKKATVIDLREAA